MDRALCSDVPSLCKATPLESASKSLVVRGLVWDTLLFPNWTASASHFQQPMVSS